MFCYSYLPLCPCDSNVRIIPMLLNVFFLSVFLVAVWYAFFTVQYVFRSKNSWLSTDVWGQTIKAVHRMTTAPVIVALVLFSAIVSYNVHVIMLDVMAVALTFMLIHHVASCVWKGSAVARVVKDEVKPNISMIEDGGNDQYAHILHLKDQELIESA